MKFISVELVNEFFGTQETGEEIGYGDRGLKFREVTCKDMDDFAINAEIGQCWTDFETTYFKIRNSHGDAEAFYLNENGEIETI